MRRGLAIAVACAVACVAGAATSSGAAAPSAKTASCANAISWKYAGSHVGKVVAVKGRIVNAFYSVASKGRPTFLNFRRPYKGAFTAVIWGENRAVFGGFPEDLFLGKNVCVTGKVTWYQGPQMVLRRQSQITILR